MSSASDSKKAAQPTARPRSKPTGAKDWRSTFGMFSGDALMKEIDEEGRRLRETERKEKDNAAA